MRDGGPAFPNITPDMQVNGSPGLSIRDYFAGQALVGFLADSSQRLINEAVRQSPEGQYVADEVALRSIVNEQLADGCYALADAMLAKRESITEEVRR